MMDEVIPNERASRDFRVKFPDDVMQENLAGQLWFGAEVMIVSWFSSLHFFFFFSPREQIENLWMGLLFFNKYSFHIIEKQDENALTFQQCLAAGSSIMNREAESSRMRPLAKAVTKTIETVRNLLREQVC